MQTENIYEEKIFPKAEMYMLGIVAIALILYALVLSLGWPFLLAPLVLIVVMYKFREFNIKITPDSVVVNYGFNKRTIPWENIDDCYLDKASAIRYGGFGLRIGRVDGKWRDVYNTLGCPRVVLSLKKDKFFKEFVFSTKNPEEVMKVVKEQIEGQKAL